WRSRPMVHPVPLAGSLDPYDSRTEGGWTLTQHGSLVNIGWTLDRDVSCTQHGWALALHDSLRSFDVGLPSSFHPRDLRCELPEQVAQVRAFSIELEVVYEVV